MLISETCEYITLHGKRGIEDVIQLCDLKMKGYVGLSRRAQCIHKDSYKGKREGQSQTRKCDERTGRRLMSLLEECYKAIEAGKGNGFSFRADRKN